MSSLITSAIIGKEILLNFQNSLVVGSKADWQYSAMFGKEESQIGNSRSIRRPIAVTLQENNMSWNAANSAVTETYVKLVVDRSLTVPMSFTEGDMALKIERFSERYIGPTVRQIAAVLDARVCDSISNSTVATASATSGLSTAGLDGNAVGTPVRSDHGWLWPVGDLPSSAPCRPSTCPIACVCDAGAFPASASTIAARSDCA